MTASAPGARNAPRCRDRATKVAPATMAAAQAGMLPLFTAAPEPLV